MNFSVNWKTTVAGLVTIALGALSTFAGVRIPGFNLDFMSALIPGVGLIMAKDGNVTGGTTPAPK